MLESLRIWPLLRGHRGRPAVDLDALLEVLVRFSLSRGGLPGDRRDRDQSAARHVRGRGGAGRARGHRPGPGRPARRAPFSHLAIRPYPEEYTREVTTETVCTRRCGRSSPRTSRSGTRCSRPARSSRSTCASAAWSSTPTRWPPASASSTTTASWRSWRRSRRTGERKLAGVGRLVADPDHARCRVRGAGGGSLAGQGPVSRPSSSPASGGPR